MATIEQRNGSYRITVSCGYNSAGKQIKKRMTWTPKPNMTRRQIEKELDRQAVLFEEKCQTGQFLDGNITLAEFSERWFNDYALKQLKNTTIKGYREYMRRILPALGHIKLAKLQPHHLMEFYNNLSEGGIRLDTKYKPCDNFKDIFAASECTQKELTEKAGVSKNAVSLCLKGANVSKATAEKLTAALGGIKIFEPVNEKAALSDKTISEHHRLLSSILTAAVQWQVIPYNPCQRVKPPKVERKEAVALDVEQATALIDCLRDEPIKYRAAVMMLLYTGLRRGELLGLEWGDVDFKKNTVSIDKTILYTSDTGIYEDTPKTRTSNRVISIPTDMIILLNTWKIEQCKQRLAVGDQWVDSGKIFTSDTGAVIRPDRLSAWFKKFIRKNNLPDIHLHSLRHTAATLLITSGVDVATVSKRLGHSDRTTTLNIYTHAIKSADEAAADILQEILSPKKNCKTV